MRTLKWTLPSLIALLLGAAAPAVGATAKKGPAEKADPPAGAAAPAPAADVGSDPPAGSSPMADLKKSNQELNRLLAKKPPSWSPETEAQQGEVKKIVGTFLDYEELAHRSLARHWDTITPKQRQEFVAVLRDLVERNYVKEVHGNPNFDLKFTKENKQGREASVTAVLNTTARGKKVKTELEYKLLYKQGRWLVYDVITDDQSLLENYRAEFNKIIVKESFDALLNRMKKKLTEKSG